jgi:hypothetical protein
MVRSYRKRHHRGRIHKKGGSHQYSDAASYGVHVNGTTNQQYNRVFDTSGPYANIPGNLIIGAQGENAGYPLSVSTPFPQKGGKKTMRRRRGGNLSGIINKAIVPLGILGLQHTYKKKRHFGKKTRKHR